MFGDWKVTIEGLTVHPGREGERWHAHTPAKWAASGARRHLLLLAAILMSAPALHAAALAAAHAPSAAAHTVGESGGSTSLKSITITAAQERRRLRDRLARFLSSVTVDYMRDSLPRWGKPVCPLVAGLPRDQGEFILARITAVAAAAHSPLAGRHCKANLIVIATSSPERFLSMWWRHDPEMYTVCNGLGGVEEFLDSKKPVRAWYNIVPAGRNGGRAVPVDMDAPAMGGALNSSTYSSCTSMDVGATRLLQGSLQLAQVYAVVDMRQMKGVTIGQLADDVSMVGLAQIRPDSHPREPSILTWFENRKHRPEGLSAWDRALLYALYQTPQSSPLQVSLIESGMVSRISPTR